MPEAGEYLLANVGFSKQEHPFVSLAKDNTFTELLPLNETMTLRFDTTQRFCIGWGDITTGERFVCPDQQTIDKKYEQCSACQNRTGFNPAFYHAASVSKQQEKRNLQPHFLYLAHFGKGIVKVGISYEARGRSRLLEQGARVALILDTFPTAHIARQYEAQIAALPGLVENVQLRRKVELLTQTYDARAGAQELIATRTQVEQSLGREFAKNDVLYLDDRYFPSETPELAESFDCSKDHLISGTMIGALGSLFFLHQQDTPLLLPMKKYLGYKLALTYEKTLIELPARQISLF